MSKKRAKKPCAEVAGAGGDQLLASLDCLAAGGTPDPVLCARLAQDSALRRQLAERDPSAVFSMLSVLPLEASLPARPVLPVRSRSGALLRRRVFAALAAVLGLAALLSLAGTDLDAGPGAVRNLAHQYLGTAGPSSGRYYQVVTKVDSPTAEIIVLVPPEASGPTVTLIVDEEVDL